MYPSSCLFYIHEGRQYILTKANLVLQATAFKEGIDWGNRDEVEKWDPRGIISFHENSWIKNYKYVWVENVPKPVNDILGGSIIQCLIFEDNLPSPSD